jgi:hypothetical protein
MMLGIKRETSEGIHHATIIESNDIENDDKVNVMQTKCIF